MASRYFPDYLRLAACGTALALLAACSSEPQSMVTRPVRAIPQQPLSAFDNQGSIFQTATAQMLYEEAVASRVGDTLTIQIQESLTGSNSATTNASKNGSVAFKGPGSTSSMSGVVKELFDLNVTSSGSDTFKGTGTTNNTNSMTGTLAVSVIDVLPNGMLEIAGDKRIAVNGDTNVLRFSGLVKKRDIKTGNVVSSQKVADVRLEQVGHGVVGDASTVGWLQRTFMSVLGFD
ncbi:MULTISPECIES: flagellar basal body L-ring protein FlgH [Silvimonas]|uniref:flagellar basal body L-ring protein FlgH n=1 Tax=Silvimonas TaxID=300264 RepID=UPI0024B3584F|nr:MULTISPECIES: flagellar basal body L-ring protein FlgH [Silvimonas]MDR3426616.1 flagellar basal body L-ring protein FlgH [Silvimonas sp.]